MSDSLTSDTISMLYMARHYEFPDIFIVFLLGRYPLRKRIQNILYNLRRIYDYSLHFNLLGYMAISRF